MSDPILNYASPKPNQPTALRTATWIMLLIFGSLMSLVGTCAGIPLIRSLTTDPLTAMLSPLDRCLIVIETILLFAVMLGSGGTYFWTSFGVRRRSRRSSVAALIVTYVSISLIFILFILNIVENLYHGRMDVLSIFFPLLLYCLIAMPNSVMAWFLHRVLREHPFGGAP